MGNKSGRHEIDSVFVLVLFVLFAGSILMVLLLGASCYERIVLRDSRAYDARTGVQYVAAKLRHGDEAGSIQAGSFSDRQNTEADDISTLYLRLNADGEFYYTKIYYYDGYIRELLCSEDAELHPEDGQEVLAATSFFVCQTESLLQVTVGDENGTEHKISLAVRSDEEE